MNLEMTKQQLRLFGKSVLLRSVEAFEKCPLVDSIVVVARAGEEAFAKEELQGISKLTAITTGGATRFDSVLHGLDALSPDTDYIAIHDGARCLVTDSTIQSVISAAYEYGASTPAHRVTDTVKRVDTDGFVTETVPRDELLYVSTPQVFRFDLYKKAIEENTLPGDRITDDNMLLENIGVSVKCVIAEDSNMKLTRKDDLDYLEYLLEKREGHKKCIE